MLRAPMFLACLVLFTSASLAQHASALSSSSPGQHDLYAAEPTVTERFDTTYHFLADGTGSRLDTAVIHVQTEAALHGLAVLTIPYNSATQHVEFVSVRVRKPNGSTVLTPGSEAQDRPTPVTEATPLYSSTHLALLPLRGLALGDRLEYQIRTVYTAAEVKDQFFGIESFGRGRVILERTIELRVPLSRYLQVLCPQHPAQVSEVDGERTYRWTGAQTVPTSSEHTGGSALEAEADNITPAIAWTTFHSWAEVGAWFRELTLHDTAASPEVKHKADDLVFGLATPRARTDALYNYVSQQVRSTNVPLGQGPWQPHTAPEVLASQFGDSKDKAVLLLALLRAENLPASLVLLPGNRQVDESVPAPLWFTEVGVVAGAPGAVLGGSSPLWLDPISEVAPPGVLDSPLRDRLALVLPATGSASLIRTPAELPFTASSHFEAAGTLTEAGALTAHITLQTRGDDELHLRQNLRTLGQAQWDRLGRAVAQAYGFPGEVSNTAFDAPEQATVPLHMSFDLSDSSYSDWENFRILPLESVPHLPFVDRASSPGREIDLGGKRTETSISRLTLPGGFSADLPPAVHVRAAFADFDQTSHLEAAGKVVTLVSERTVVVKVSRLPATSWDEYRHFLDQAIVERPWIQLTGATAIGKDRHPPAPGENTPRAAELVDAASAAAEKGNWADATRQLDQAQALNPRQPFLWSGYAAVAHGLGQFETAIADERREWQAHPEEAANSYRLAADLATGGHFAEAITVLQTSLVLNPRDERTSLQLGALQATSDAATGEKTYRNSLLLNPDSLALKLALGELLLHEGNRPEASTLLGTVASESQNPTELNDAAFSLADAGLNLPLAEQASRRSVQLLNAAAVRGDDRGHLEAALRRSVAFLASWDTYGWVLFRQGYTTEAEPWLHAAWADGAGPSATRHYAELLQKQGKGAEAAALLRSTPAVPAVHGAIKTRTPATVTAGRTVSLPKPPGLPSGTATFAIEAALNSASAASYVSGDAGLSSLSSAIARLDLHTAFPPGSPAVLVRLARVRCGEATTCTVDLLPFRSSSAIAAPRSSEVGTQP